MKHPIRSSLIAAVAFAPLTLGVLPSGLVTGLARLLAVFFALHFVLLLAVTVFSNLRWRLTPPPSWAGTSLDTLREEGR